MEWTGGQPGLLRRTLPGKLPIQKGAGRDFRFKTIVARNRFQLCRHQPHDDGLEGNPDLQNLETNPLKQYGGYDYRLAGSTPWAIPKDIELPHWAFKSFPSRLHRLFVVGNVNDRRGQDFQRFHQRYSRPKEARTIAHWVQREKGMSVGAVTSVPICHATPAAAYAHNVSRDDYQDLTRDMLGLKSISHPESPLPGMDVVLGGGWGETTESNKAKAITSSPEIDT